MDFFKSKKEPVQSNTDRVREKYNIKKKEIPKKEKSFLEKFTDVFSDKPDVEAIEAEKKKVAKDKTFMQKVEDKYNDLTGNNQKEEKEDDMFDVSNLTPSTSTKFKVLSYLFK